jgi:hypothetical protein
LETIIFEHFFLFLNIQGKTIQKSISSSG